MLEAKTGTIVNISSLAGRCGVPYYAPFSASKYAIRGFSEALRRELAGTGVRVVCIFPGAVADDMAENVEFDRFGLQCVTAAKVGAAIVRGVRLNTPEVFLGIGDSVFAHWNDFLPATVDFAADMLHRGFESAARTRTAEVV
jgi:short-subunit dehydrogenase